MSVSGRPITRSVMATLRGKTRQKKMRNIPLWVERQQLGKRAVDPGCRPWFGVSCQATFVRFRAGGGKTRVEDDTHPGSGP
jgi:hypothetical protein